MESKTMDLKENLKLLVILQEKDIVLYRMRQRLETIPHIIAEQSEKINQFKTEFEDTKKHLTQLQLSRKQKELEVEAKDGEIRKHGTELNAVKTNEAYRALLSEIDKCKKDKISIEDEILVIMENTEKESAGLKEREVLFKQNESESKSTITALEAESAKLQNDMTGLEKERNDFAGQINPDLLKRYEYIRDARAGIGIVPIEGENCGGCHIGLRPQVINDVFKSQELIFCDSCSRILYKKPD